MKKSVWTWIGGLLGLFLIAVASCKKSPPPKPIPITPLQTLVNSDTSLTLFHQMLLDANDLVLLKDTTISLLLPTNAVLRQAGYTTITIDSTSAYLLDRILRYGYVPGAIAPESGAYTAYPTYLGASLFIEKDTTAGLFLLNGSTTASGTGTAVGQATVYYLNQLLPGAADSLPSLLSADSTLSLFAAAVLRTNLYDSALLSGSYTVLAPVNSAFQQAGYDSVGAIDSADINTLVQLVAGQILKGPYFTNTFPVPGPVVDLLGNPITVSQTGNTWQFSASGNPVPVNWLSGNQVAGTNIVVHKTDAILSP
jgi:uncharacterized surface protein with fasciclin (FAS1) repeats